MSKLRSGHWIPARVIGLEKPPMLLLDIKGHCARVNQPKVRHNPDEWHVVVIPGLVGKDGVAIVPEPSLVGEEPPPEVPFVPEPAPSDEEPPPGVPVAASATDVPEYARPSLWASREGDQLLQLFVEMSVSLLPLDLGTL